VIAVIFVPGVSGDPARKLEDQDGLDGHIKFIRRNRLLGRIIEGAPFHDPGTQVADDLIGRALLAIDCVEDARRLIETEPAVQSGAFSYRLYPRWEAALPSDAR
jgi:hypothetical protein